MPRRCALLRPWQVRIEPEAIVPGDLKLEENILLACALADIVNDERHAAAFPPRDESDMRAAVRKPPGDDIAGLVIAPLRGNRQDLTVAAEEHGEIWNAPVVDIRIGAR